MKYTWDSDGENTGHNGGLTAEFDSTDECVAFVSTHEGEVVETFVMSRERAVALAEFILWADEACPYDEDEDY